MTCYFIDFMWEKKKTGINYKKYESTLRCQLSSSYFVYYIDVSVYWFNENTFDAHHDSGGIYEFSLLQNGIEEYDLWATQVVEKHYHLLTFNQFNLNYTSVRKMIP